MAAYFVIQLISLKTVLSLILIWTKVLESQQVCNQILTD